jgi:hypothetical protein
MLPGLGFRETMSGNYWRLDTPTEERALAVTLDARTRDLSDLARDRTFSVTGTIDAEGLASGRPLTGTVALKFVQQGRIHYRLVFEADDGRRCELSGQKEWSGLAPVESLTLLAATLYDDSGEEFARATLRFDVRADWAAWLKSFRLSFAR